MKTMFNHKCLKQIQRYLLLLMLCITPIVFWFCSSENDDVDTWQIMDDGIVSTWVLKSAEFRIPVDLDGPGPMLATTDAKAIIYQIFDVYANCSSIDDIQIQFTTEPPLGPTALFLYETGQPVYSANAVCPQGQGVTSWVFDYIFIDNSGHPDPPKIAFMKETINDPLHLFEWNGMSLIILNSEVRNGKYTIIGESTEGSLISSLPDPKPDLTFDFVMERVDPN